MMAILRKNRLVLLLAIVIIMVYPKTCFGLTKELLSGRGFNIGRLRIKPTFSTASGFTSNIDLIKSDRTVSALYRIKPGISMALPLSRLYLYGSGDVAYTIAVGSDDTWAGQVNAMGRYNLTRMLSIGTSYKWTKAQLFQQVSGDTTNLQDISTNIKHEFTPRFSVALKGGFQKYEVMQDIGVTTLTDYNQFSGGPSIDYKLSPLTMITFNNNYSYRYFETKCRKDHASHGFNLGVSRKLSSRINVGANSGYTHRDYRGYGDITVFTWGSNARWILSPFSTLYLRYSRGIHDTFYPKDDDILNNPFSIEESRVNVLDETFQYIITDGLSSNIVYRLSSKDTFNTVLGLVRSYSNNSVGQIEGLNLANPPLKIEENNFYYGISYTHRFTSWCAFNAKWRHSYRASNVRESYEDYGAEAGLQIAF